MTRTEQLRSRLLLIDKQISDILDELRKYGYDIDPSNFNKVYNKYRNGDKSVEIRRITDEIVSGWENQK